MVMNNSVIIIFMKFVVEFSIGDIKNSFPTSNFNFGSLFPFRLFKPFPSLQPFCEEKFVLFEFSFQSFS